MDIQSSTTTCRDPFNESSFSNQLFLINFIMGTYLGPDVYSDIPRRSASHRVAEGLLPYTANNLGSSFVSFSQLENLYYYVLRKARPNLVLKPNVLHTYLYGNLPLRSSGVLKDCRQFTSFFPPNLHELKRHSDSYGIVKGIVLINDPLTSYMEKDDLERFIYLSGIDNLKIDVKKFHSYQRIFRKSGEECEQSCMVNGGEEIAETIFNGKSKASGEFLETYKRRRLCDLLPTPLSSQCLVPFSKHESEMGSKSDSHVLIPLSTISHVEERTPFQSIAFTGTAPNGTARTPFGVLDIGVNKTSYFFRIALPGARRDFGELNCEIKSNGEVGIQGSTTGGGTTKKYSGVCKMKLQQLSLPGSFALAFHLPGPVDPRLFSPNLRWDGIFEGVVIKHPS